MVRVTRGGVEGPWRREGVKGVVVPEGEGEEEEEDGVDMVKMSL